MRRYRVRSILLTAVLSCGIPAVSSGQEIASQAFRDGVTAFNAGDFDKARDLFAKASQTDTRNAEVFLWLGKAQYQLGKVDDAITAWRQTTTLAPNEPYAKRMLESLTGQKQSAETTLSVVEALLKDELWAPALASADRLLKDASLTDEQRNKAMVLRTRGLLSAGRTEEALAAASELLVRQPALADDAEVQVLIGRAKLRTNDRRIAEGLATLRNVLAQQPNTPAAALAHFELLAYDLGQGVGRAKVAALGKWIADHPNHDLLPAARRRLIDAHLLMATVGGEPARDAALSPSDLAALEAAGQMFKQLVRADEALDLTNRIVAHLNERYAKHGAFAAAKAGAQALLANPLPSTSRLVALRANAQYTTQLAAANLESQVAAGDVQGAGNQLPVGISEALRLFGTINEEPGSGGAWKEQAALAERLRGLAQQLLWPVRPETLKAPLDWSVQVAMPVIKANADAAAVGIAASTVAQIVNELARVDTDASLALSVNSSLLAAMSPHRPEWADAAWRQVDLLDVAAVAVFRENTEAGKAVENGKLSKPQQDLLAVLAQIVKTQASTAPRVFERLEKHLQPWLSSTQPSNAEAAYAQLAQSLPEAQRLQAELALVNLWVRQAINDENRLIAAGLAVSDQVDPRLLKAMRRLYELQGDRPPAGPFLQQLRSLATSIIDHYVQRKDFALARTIASAKPEGDAAKPSPTGDTFLQYQLARLDVDEAWDQLQARLGQFGGSKGLTLSDAMKNAITALTKFITDHPADPLADKSAQIILSLANTYQQHQAFDAAVQIYRDLATFAAKQPALSQATPVSTSLEERAEFLAIGALENKARTALHAVRAAEKGEIKPPTRITDEYAAALAAYESFIEKRPESALVGQAMGRVMTIALDWAQVDAWDVADGIYSVLLKPALKVRDPERLAFAKAMCQIGKVMPDHAREVLAALASGRTTVPARPDAAATAVAATPGLGAPVTQPGQQAAGMGGGGFGSGSGEGPQATIPRPAVPAGRPMGSAGGMADAPAEVAAEDRLARADREVLAAISAQEARRSAMIARLRDDDGRDRFRNAGPTPPAQNGQSADASKKMEAPPVLSEAEIARQAEALEAAYKIFREIRQKHPNTPTAQQCRGEILVIIGHWRVVSQWQRAADQARAFLADNPKDPELPKLRLSIAQDTLTWAAQSVDLAKMGNNRQRFLAEISNRFDAARAEFSKIVAEFPDERQLRQDAQWQLATSFLTQAHTVGSNSPTLARGQYVRAVKEMRRAAGEYYDHPQVQTIPQVLWDISQELSSRGFHEEAISVWNDLVVEYPASPLSQQAAQQMAAAYQSQLGRPLRAAEVYLEINFARGGADQAAQNAIYQIGANLKSQSRWVEALHVLGTFVASFPQHPEAGQALTMIGQIHQTNEAWPDAIQAYRRVTSEYAVNAQWVQEARWAIAECTVNLSLWREAIGAYQSFVESYPNDPRIPEANRRSGILKDVAKYQQLVDENGPKAFDAQFQIATIMQTQLANPTKAVSEFRKVAQKWPGSHLSDDALYQVGQSYQQMGRTSDARDAMAAMAARYPESPLADDALLAIGKSYEEEAQQIAGYTREQQFDFNKDVAQKEAYSRLNSARVGNRQAQQGKIQELRRVGKGAQADLEEARGANENFLWDQANVSMAAAKAKQDVEATTASQLADRQDKINAALRKAVDSYAAAGKVPGADKAGEALLRVATIYGERLNDSQQAMATWLEIVRQFSGTAVAEEASWRIAQNYEKSAKFAEAIDAYKAFLRNYRGSARAADAQFAVAESYEHLGEWVKAMDSYGNYVNSFPQGPMIEKAKEQITWIKTYRL